MTAREKDFILVMGIAENTLSQNKDVTFWNDGKPLTFNNLEDVKKAWVKVTVKNL